ncbi:MFS transporter [Rhodococcus sp. NPDC059968]|uniref:MFS transporter n=1 Tax=Rhodococcus sp. NPDC059968 TaxID=3347017 RepID=UPI003672F1E9
MPVKPPRRWLILILGLLAQAANCVFAFGIPFLVPTLLASEGLSLTQAGMLVAAPSIGFVATLILWGAAADAFGERLIMALGLGSSGVVIAFAAVATRDLAAQFVLFLLAGACASSVNAASGRVVMGWFDATERGFAMGVRQTAQPLGMGLAGLTLPPIADEWGLRAALWFPAGLALVVAGLVAVLVIDPPRESAGDTDTSAPAVSPYRGSTLWRLHGASALLVVPQFAVSAFAPVYLVTVQHWDAVRAGWFLAGVQVFGALGRIGAGYWSDRVGSRFRPIRQIACASAAVMLLVALGDVSWPWLVVVGLTLAAVITVSPNGLGFTAAAELAGREWSGRAMGVQNTIQTMTSATTPPVLGLVIVSGGGYVAAFCVAAVFPAVAVVLVPARTSSG